LEVNDGGKSYNGVVGTSLRPPVVVTPEIAKEFNRSFKLVRKLPCDVPLGDHPAQYNLEEKYSKLQSGGANPFIDPAGCQTETNVEEAMFHAIVAEQKKSAH